MRSVSARRRISGGARAAVVSDAESGPAAEVATGGEKAVVASSDGQVSQVPLEPPEEVALASAPESEVQYQKLAVVIRRELLQVMRRETGDPYGGLPADDVLARLDDRFPQVGFPERMMARLEVEQRERLAHVARLDALAEYEAQTVRADSAGNRTLERSAGRRAFGAMVLLLLVGVGLIASHHEAAGEIVLGTTVVGVVGAFVSSRIGKPR